MLISKFEIIFPEKVRKISSVDSPWMTQKLKKLDRKRKRIYRTVRCSEKWKNLNKFFKKEVKSAKNSFYRNTIADLKKKKKLPSGILV